MERIIIVTGSNKKIKQEFVRNNFSNEAFFVFDFEQIERKYPFRSQDSEALHHQLLDILFVECIEQSKVLVFPFCTSFQNADEGLIHFIRRFKKLNIQVDIEALEEDESNEEYISSESRNGNQGYPKSFVMGVFTDFTDDLELRQELG
jgi:hypothetical protein